MLLGDRGDVKRRDQVCCGGMLCPCSWQPGKFQPVACTSKAVLHSTPSTYSTQQRPFCNEADWSRMVVGACYALVHHMAAGHAYTLRFALPEDVHAAAPMLLQMQRSLIQAKRRPLLTSEAPGPYGCVGSSNFCPPEQTCMSWG